MPHFSALLGFALISFGMVLTPGPNMIYLISRSITQGPAAGIVSLGGVALGFVFYMLCAAFGITALLLAVPYAYDALRLSGAAYLLWLAWQALKPNGRSPFQVRKLAVDGPRKLFAMGFVTNLLNPKIAMLYLALLPQFIDPAQGSVLTQSLALGSIQIVISVSVNAMIALAAGSIALFRHKAEMAVGAALADGHRAGGAGHAHGAGDAAGVGLLNPASLPCRA
jgi:threonine/homoserine/homoserine lactone efflux protein